MDNHTADLTGLVDRLRRDRRKDPYQGRRQYSQTARDLADRCAALYMDDSSGVVADDLDVVRPQAQQRHPRAVAELHVHLGLARVVDQDLQQLMGLYARACIAAPQNPRRLAGRLVKLECDGPGWPRIALRDFAPALGAPGLAEVERRSRIGPRRQIPSHGRHGSRFGICVSSRPRCPVASTGTCRCWPIRVRTGRRADCDRCSRRSLDGRPDRRRGTSS